MLSDKFSQYVRPTDEELAKLLKSGIIVVDASALLNLYRYSQTTREDFFKVYEHNSVRTRLWMPYQVGTELMKNRLDVIFGKYNEIGKLRDDIELGLPTVIGEALEKAREAIQEVARYRVEHPHIDIKGLNSDLEKFEKSTLRAWKKIIDAHLDSSKSNPPSQANKKDEIYRRIERMFRNQINDEFEDKRLEQIKKEGEVRYKDEVPPGFKDSSKTDPYGDLIIWYEIMEYAEKQKKGIVFVTDDEKIDWVETTKGRKIGPRIELVKELHKVSGQSFHLYNSPRFLEYANKMLDEKVRPESVREAEDVNEQLLEQARERARERARANEEIQEQVNQQRQRLFGITRSSGIITPQQMRDRHEKQLAFAQATGIIQTPQQIVSDAKRQLEMAQATGLLGSIEQVADEARRKLDDLYTMGFNSSKRVIDEAMRQIKLLEIDSLSKSRDTILTDFEDDEIEPN